MRSKVEILLNLVFLEGKSKERRGKRGCERAVRVDGPLFDEDGKEKLRWKKEKVVPGMNIGMVVGCQR